MGPFLHMKSLFFILGTSLIFSSISMDIAKSAEPTRTIFTSVSSGDHFSCSLTDKGYVYCWGDNERSQLGTSNRLQNLIPNKVYEIKDAVEISAGRDFACARIADGGVACWGRGDLGQTGDGFDDKQDRFFATRIPTISTAIGITAGTAHACALLKDKSVHCWGSNDNWQLGNSYSVLEKLPIKVLGIPDIKEIKAGYNHTCALAESGFIYCWGDNRFGQLGNGNKNIFKSSPSDVLGIKNVNSLHLGADTSCAITTVTTVKTVNETKCWGAGRDGQVLGSALTNHYFPADTSLNNLSIFSPGRTKACGIFNSANSRILYCWGTTIGTYPVSGPASLSVSLGYDHGCAVTSLGMIQCFGWNHKGQLGTGVTSVGNSSIATVSALNFPDWAYYINSWEVSYEDNLAILKWVGGVGRFKVRIDGLGIVCEDLGVSTCKFGPVKSATTYRGEITALNTGGASPLIGVSSIEFTTGKLISALDQFLLEQAAKEKEKVELAKIDALLKSLSKQLVFASEIELKLQVEMDKDAEEFDTYLATLDAENEKMTIARDAISKMSLILKDLVLRIKKKIGA